jgi:ankyrin repeat protein
MNEGFGLATNSSGPASPELIIDESTPWVAAGDGDLELLKKALSILNVPVNAADSNGFTFVHAAAAYNQIHVLLWLVHQEGCNVNVQDSDGDTPLHHCDRVDAARVLVEEGGAIVSLPNNDGMTALQQKVEELKELEQDEEVDRNDEDFIQLKELVEYLTNYNQNPQE